MTNNNPTDRTEVSTDTDAYQHTSIVSKDEVADEIQEWVDDARALAQEIGLDPYHVNYWVVDNDEMNALAAYDGFQHRYPHYRWAMKWDKQRKQDRYTGSHIFELVNNDDPANAFLQRSNTIADQKAVVTHVEAHSDFFANNRWFDDDPGGADMLAHHADRIESIVERNGVDREDVERLIDTVSCIEDTVDQHDHETTEDGDGASISEHVESIDVDDSIKEQLFDEEWIEEREAAIDEHTFEEDVVQFLAENGGRYDEEEEQRRELEDWEREVIEMLHEEAQYFAPQRMTKVMNEGHACVAPDTRVVTEDGIVEMRNVVENQMDVSDGDTIRTVESSDIVEDYDTVTVTTAAGYTLTGSTNHRVVDDDGEWVRLDEISEGDSLNIVGGNDVWAETYEDVDWTASDPTPTAEDVADEVGCSVSTIYEYQNDGYITDEMAERVSGAIDDVGWTGQREGRTLSTSVDVDVSETVDETFGRFLGYQVSEGMIAGDDTANENKVQQTNGCDEIVDLMEDTMSDVLGMEPKIKVDGSRTRVYVDSVQTKDMLVSEFDLPTGKSSSERFVPEHVFRSPKSVVCEFLSALFDGDAYAGEEGIIYSTASEQLAEEVQQLLLNFGIWSNRTEQNDGCWHVHMTGQSAQTFIDEIGFNHSKKQERAEDYVESLEWFETETWTDEVVDVETGTGDVYDITVEETHQYEAAGFINHNSFWETIMMADEGFADDNEFLNYADHHARVLEAPGFNPYRIGREIWEHIENEANKREVLDKLLRVDGVTPKTFHSQVDISAVEDELDQPDSYSPAVRNFSLLRSENRDVLRSVSTSELDEQYRYMFETDRYETITEALSDVDYGAGWDRMFEIRETHVDATFIGEFVTEEFIERNDYFAYDYNPSSGQYEVSSTDPMDVKKKLLLKFTNFGKPTILVEDDNYRNRGELLLAHQYNGVSLDTEQAKDVLERVYELWGRPVHLRTVVKESEAEEPDVRTGSVILQIEDREVVTEEYGMEISYDGEEFTEVELDADFVEYLAADEIDYECRPEEWL